MTPPDLAKAGRFLAAQGAPGALVAGVTGAHFYGFPSPDSDLDLKGIHVAATAEVVSLRPPADAIDFLGVFEGLEMDYTSHELLPSLRLLMKGNGNVLERILTPFQVLESPDAVELCDLARGAVSKKFFHHYRGFFSRICEDVRKAARPTVKGVLYAYRSALTGTHLLRTGECVGDVTRLAPLYGFPRVDELVAVKRGGLEHGEMDHTSAFDHDRARLEALLAEAHAASRLPGETQNVAAIDGFLVRTRRLRFRSA